MRNITLPSWTKPALIIAALTLAGGWGYFMADASGFFAPAVEDCCAAE